MSPPSHYSPALGFRRALPSRTARAALMRAPGRAPISRALIISLQAILATVLLLLAAGMLAPAAATEVLMLPGRCEVTRGKLRLLPMPAGQEQAHAIVGQRSMRTIRWCGAASEPACDDLQLYRFTIDCGGERVGWVAVAAAILATRAIPAHVENGKLTISPAKPSTREQRRIAGDQATTCARRAFPVAPAHLGHGPADAGECKARIGEDMPSSGIAFPAGFAPLTEIGARLANTTIAPRATPDRAASGTTTGSVAETDRVVDSSALPDLEPPTAAADVEPVAARDAPPGVDQAAVREAQGTREASQLHFVPKALEAANAVALRPIAFGNNAERAEPARALQPLALVATGNALATTSTAAASPQDAPLNTASSVAKSHVIADGARAGADARRNSGAADRATGQRHAEAQPDNNLDGRAETHHERQSEPRTVLDQIRSSFDAAWSAASRLDTSGLGDALQQLKASASRAASGVRSLVADDLANRLPVLPPALGAIASALALLFLLVLRVRRRALTRTRQRPTALAQAQLLASPPPSLEGARQIEALCEQASLTVEGLAGAPPLREVLDSEIATARDRLAGAITAMAEGGEAARRAPAICRNIVRDLDRVMRIADSALASFGQTRTIVTPPATRAEAFAVLGINAESDAAIVKKLADALRMSWHPDHARDEMDRAQREARTKQINIALELIRAQRAAEPQLQRA